MRVQIAARHCEIPDHIRKRAEEQMARLTRYEPRLSAAEVVFDEEKHRKRVEAILSVDGNTPVVASGKGDDFRGALDGVLDRLSRMLRRRRAQTTEHRGPRHAEIARPRVGERVEAD